jgi:hypothetical protein
METEKLSVVVEIADTVKFERAGFLPAMLTPLVCPPEVTGTQVREVELKTLPCPHDCCLA